MRIACTGAMNLNLYAHSYIHIHRMFEFAHTHTCTLHVCACICNCAYILVYITVVTADFLSSGTWKESENMSGRTVAQRILNPKINCEMEQVLVIFTFVLN